VQWQWQGTRTTSFPICTSVAFHVDAVGVCIVVSYTCTTHSVNIQTHNSSKTASREVRGVEDYSHVTVPRARSGVRGGPGPIPTGPSTRGSQAGHGPTFPEASARGCSATARHFVSRNSTCGDEHFRC
jgi:hypothetical protein